MYASLGTAQFSNFEIRLDTLTFLFCSTLSPLKYFCHSRLQKPSSIKICGKTGAQANAETELSGASSLRDVPQITASFQRQHLQRPAESSGASQSASAAAQPRSQREREIG